jgi:alanyl-tRNA synthetase
VGVILDKTNFYAEMGGQVADTGRDLRLARGPLGVGQEQRQRRASSSSRTPRPSAATSPHRARQEGRDPRRRRRRLQARRARRRAIAANHTATHLLNLGLRGSWAGRSTRRARSSTTPLRFDFSQSGAVKPEQLGRGRGDRDREAIGDDLPVHADLADLDTARSISGLRAVFGEAYPDPVRVVSIGARVEDLVADPSNEDWASLSIEFCGGTHLTSTGEAGAFALVQEEAVAKGIRRVVAKVPESIVGRGLKAGDWVRRASQAAGGKGGGKPDSAQGGGLGAANLPAVLEAAGAFASETLG